MTLCFAVAFSVSAACFLLQHWLFYNGGWLFQYGTVDYAGGMVIHVSSGVSALVLTTWLGKPRNGGHNRPHNVPFVVLGAALLWFGWCVAGSAMSMPARSAV